MTIAAGMEKHELTSKALNNFLVSMRPSIRKARVHLIHHHTRCIKTLSKETTSAAPAPKNTTLSDNSTINAGVADDSIKPIVTRPAKSKNKLKALKLGKEIKAVKSFSDGDLGKLVLLNAKTFNQAAREKCSAGQRAVCRLAEHEALKKCKQEFANKFGDSVKQLPFCIKVLGVSHRYKKIRKLGMRGKKDTFLENQRFCLRLLREIGGIDFASAEDLVRKMGKQKKKEQSATRKSTNDKASSTEEDNSDADDDHQDMDPESSSDEEETIQQKEVKNKIHQKLDALLGKWDDEESGSDLEEASPKLTVVKDAIESTGSALAKVVPTPFKNETKPVIVKLKPDSKLSDVSQKGFSTDINSESTSNELQQSSTGRICLPIKNTKTRLELKDKKPSSIAPSAFFAAYASKEVDLENVKAAELIPVSSKKRGRELNPDDELEEVPRKAAERNKRHVLNRTAAEAEKNVHKEDDFDPTNFNIRFNAKKLAEALLQKDDIRKPTSIAARGSRGAGRRGSRGGAVGSSRGGSRGRGGGARGGFEGGPWKREAGTERGRGGGARGGFGGGPWNREAGTERGRGHRGDESRSGRGRGNQRGSEKGRGAAFSNSSTNRAESSQSNEHLHPSWAAKKQEKIGIAGFQGKKIVFG